jgi:hypothetical protein
VAIKENTTTFAIPAAASAAYVVLFSPVIIKQNKYHLNESSGGIQKNTFKIII